MFCIKCGAKIVEGAKFCQKCGAPAAASGPPSADGAQVSPAGKPAGVPSAKQQAAEAAHVSPQEPNPTGPPPSGGSSQAPSPIQPSAAPPAGNQGAGTPPPVGQPGTDRQGTQQAAGSPTAGQPQNKPPVGSQAANPSQTPPPGCPGAPIIPPKKKTARWPWVVCGLGVAAIAFVIVAILGSALGQPSESIEPSSSQVQEVSLTETYTNEEEGFSFQYPSAWEPVAQEDMDNYAGLAETESTLVLLANEYEDIPEANSYIMVSRYDTDEGDEELLALDDEAFLEEIQIDGSHVEAASLTIDGVPVKEITCTVDESNLYRRTYYYVANQGFFRVDMLCSVPQSSEFIRFFDAVMDSYTITVFPEPTEEPVLSPTQYIQMVTGGYRIDDPEFTYGDAFNSFFSSPHWEFFISEDDEKIVEFTGDCTYRDTPVTACIQFVIYEEDETFEAVWLDFNEVPQDTITMNALISTAFEELEEAVYGPANEWAASEHSYMRENDLYAAITFYPDGTFSMVANLYEGLGNVYGTYTVLDDRLSCVVDSRDFGGFVGDDVQEFEMIFAGDNLQYSGSQIGTCVDGSIYTPS